jgi:hypothetical protein
MMKVKVKGLDELSRQLKKLARDISEEARDLNGSTVSMKIPADPQGLIDRECPHCEAPFKIDEHSWDGHVRDEVWCPYFGHRAKADQWVATAHVKQLKQIAHARIETRFNKILEGRRPSPLETTPGIERVALEKNGKWLIVALPPAALEMLRQERICAKCNCRFAFVGAAFFCPLCGDNSAEVSFDQTLATIRRSVAALPGLCIALQDDDIAAEATRHLLEKHTQDLVTAFQRIGEALFLRLSGNDAPKNAFQRLEGSGSGNALWASETGHAYDSHLTPADWAAMILFFQRRHLLAHSEGIIDADYLRKSGDPEYSLGQRLRVTPQDVLRFAGIVETLVTGMRADVAGTAPTMP